MQVIVAALLIAATYRPLPAWSPVSGWHMSIDWRVPTIRSTQRFLLFAGPICFVLLTKVLMYSKTLEAAEIAALAIEKSCIRQDAF